jgi:hypothetical protein
MTYSLESMSQLKLSETAYRVTLLSNTWAPWTKTVPASQLSDVEPDLISLVQGDCENPSLHPLLKEFSRSVHVVFDRICVRVWTEDHWVPKEFKTETQMRGQESSRAIPSLPEKSDQQLLKQYGPPLLLVGLLTGLIVNYLKNQNASEGSSASATGNEVTSSSPSGNVINIPARL